MIGSKFTTTFEVRRSAWVTVEIGDKTVDRTVESVEATFNGYKQQATAEYAQYYNLSMSKGFTVWCPLSAQVAEGDTIVADDVSYTVRARQDFRDGCNPHAQLAVELIGVVADES